jgi:stage II sporulation protein D
MPPMIRFASLDRTAASARARRRPPLIRSALAAAAVTLTCAAAGASSPLPAAPVALNPTFVFVGHGWGHGIGMSQYGAYGYALHGFGYAQILAHYYPGTTLGPAPLARVRVLLADSRPSLTVGSTAALKLTDGSGKVRTLAAGTYAVRPGPTVKLDPAKPPQAMPGPLVFAPSSSSVPLALAGTTYRGTLQVASAAGKLSAVNTVGVDPYVQGVVPREMPSSWPADALEAQAVAARSYALANRKLSGTFDVYADTRSQVYGGVAAETPATNAAVAATAGEVVLSGGTVADTLFSSTSGGRTAAIEDVWPASEPVSYLVSVPDPYDSVSPYHNWGPIAIPSATVAARLRVPGPLVDLKVAVNPSARVSTLTAVSPFASSSVTGEDARSLLGLRSSWFRVGVLGQLAAVKKSITFGTKVTLTGVARSVAGPAVQSRVPGGPWKALTAVTPAAGGAVSLVTQPLVTTDYRLGSGVAGGLPTRVGVAPRVRLYAVTVPGHLRGYVRPVLAGTNVQVQRLDGTTWTTVGSAPLDAQGSFDASLALAQGTYRARLAAGHGLVAGVSPPLEVTTG